MMHYDTRTESSRATLIPLLLVCAALAAPAALLILGAIAKLREFAQAVTG